MHAKRLRLTFLVGCALAAVAALLLVGNQGPAGAAQSPSAATGAPSPEAIATFGALGRARTSADSMSQLLNLPGNPIATSDWQDRVGVDLSQARRLQIPGHGVWLAAGSQSVCLIAQRATDAVTAMCSRLSDVRSTGMTTDMAVADHATLVAGVVPDGTRSIRIDLADGTSVSPRIADGAFWVTVDDPVSESIDGPNGERTLEITVER